MQGGTKSVNDIPVVQMNDCSNIADLVSNLSENQQETGNEFSALRVILRAPAEVKSWVDEIDASAADYNLKIVDPYTFMKLYAQES